MRWAAYAAVFLVLGVAGLLLAEPQAEEQWCANALETVVQRAPHTVLTQPEAVVSQELPDESVRTRAFHGETYFGCIVNEGGEPLRDLEVSLVPVVFSVGPGRDRALERLPPRLRTTTDHEGRFRFEGVGTHRYQLEVSWHGIAVRLLSSPVEVGRGLLPNTFHRVVARLNYRLTIVPIIAASEDLPESLGVYLEQQMASRGFSLAISRPWREWVPGMAAWTVESGTLNLRPVTQKLWQFEPIALEVGGDVPEITLPLRLFKAGTLSVQLVSATDQPMHRAGKVLVVEDARRTLNLEDGGVSLRMAGLGRRMWESVVAQGRVSCSGLRAGTYAVVFWAEDAALPEAIDWVVVDQSLISKRLRVPPIDPASRLQVQVVLDGEGDLERINFGARPLNAVGKRPALRGRVVYRAGRNFTVSLPVRPSDALNDRWELVAWLPGYRAAPYVFALGDRSPHVMHLARTPAGLKLQAR